MSASSPASGPRHTHEAVANQFWGLAERGTRQAAGLPQAVYDGVAGVLHNSVGLAFRTVAGGLATVGATGLIGDRLQGEQQPHLSTRMLIRAAGRNVPLAVEDLAAAYPRAGGRIVVFVHGLGEDEGGWNLRRDELGGTYGSRLEAHAGWTPVYLRVDTGAPVAENGVALTALMQRLVEAWPVPVRRIAMVGHSTGGLVIRAGCAVAIQHDDPWTTRLSDVITLGSPHLTADPALERGLPELPPLPAVRYRLVSAGLAPPRGPVGLLLGDLLVRRGAATATRNGLRLFPDADVVQVPNADQLSLLNHPDVFRALQGWLA